MKDNMAEVAKHSHKGSMAVDNSAVDQERKIVDIHMGMIAAHTRKDCKTVGNCKDCTTVDNCKDYRVVDTCKYYKAADNHKYYKVVVDNCKESTSPDFRKEHPVVDTRIVRYWVR